MRFPDYLPAGPADNVPMHPEDFAALLEWVRAKEEWGGEE